MVVNLDLGLDLIYLNTEYLSNLGFGILDWSSSESVVGMGARYARNNR